jgi:capsular exopolysaccharide synthesis family protein
MDPASTAYQVKPRRLIVLALAVMAAVALSGAAIVVLTILDTSFKTVDDVEQALGVPVLAAVPKAPAAISRKDGGGKRKHSADTSRAPTSHEDPHSAVSEAIRTMRASLLLRERQQTFVLVTSALPSEGKSFCSENLAVAFSQQEMQTVLVDLDLRIPMIEKRLLGGERRLGVSDFLLGHADFEQIIHSTAIPNLSIIPAGRHSSNPAELLLRHERVKELLRKIAGEFQRCVVDSAPLLAVSDTMNIASHFDTICLVVRSHKTPSRHVVRAAGLMARIGHPITGAVLNFVNADTSGYYYSYKYRSTSQQVVS